MSGPLYWMDRPEPEEASDDAVWVVADFPGGEIEPYEEDQPMGYREFLLPPGIASRYPAKRILTELP